MDSEWQTRADPSKCAVSRALNPLVPDRICRRHRKKSWQVSASSMPAIPMPSRSVHPSLRIVAGRRSPVRWAKDQFYGHACRRTAAFVVPTTNRCKWVGCDPHYLAAAIAQRREPDSSLAMAWRNACRTSRCSDITYIPMATGHAYLIAVMDRHSCAVLSWELSNTADTGMCLRALENAL